MTTKVSNRRTFLVTRETFDSIIIKRIGLYVAGCFENHIAIANIDGDQLKQDLNDHGIEYVEWAKDMPINLYI